eukprot:CAMPEP_0113706828 /NCGR_PEP_ID=MMETSP0038_2-20120614/27987_1 /TAXON_ID=2898 /ORGANISM="Cryptomonas paramecium" /LENGTH=74 /DNA_ID=CAMNT_0000632155 /DNA_START=331 /DNA_END=555 /DNA_ORIENTATION=- /assembly_acc=CAM_ASM_000170
MILAKISIGPLAQRQVRGVLQDIAVNITACAEKKITGERQEDQGSDEKLKSPVQGKSIMCILPFRRTGAAVKPI